MSGQRLLVAVSACVAVAMGGAGAPGVQPTEPASPPASPAVSPIEAVLGETATMPVQELLARARMAYRAAPIAERISIEMISAGGVEQSAVELSLDARPDTPRQLRLQLGPLRAHAVQTESGFTLTALHAEDGRSFVRVAEPGPLLPAALERHLPAIPLPQLWLAFGEASIAMPFAADAESQTASLETVEGRRAWIVRAQAEHARLAFAFDAESFRLALVMVYFESEQTALRLTIEPAEPAALNEWSFEVAGRDPIDGVWAFRVRPPRLRQGDPIEGWAFGGVTGRPWSLRRLLADRDAAAGEPVVGVIVADLSQPAAEPAIARAAEALEGAGAMLEALRTRRLSSGRPARRVAFQSALLAVTGVTTFDRAQLSGLFQPGPEGAARVAVPPERAAWTTVHATTIERFEPGGPVLVVLIDRHERFIGAIPIPVDRAHDPDEVLEIAAEIAALVAAWEWPEIAEPATDPAEGAPADEPDGDATDPQKQQEPSDPPGS